MKKILKIIGLIVLVPIIYVFAVILLGTFTDYKPREVEVISNMEDEFVISSPDTFSVIIWNIGYAGLGEEMDFSMMVENTLGIPGTTLCVIFP